VRPSESVRIIDQSTGHTGVEIVAVCPALSGGVAAHVAALLLARYRLLSRSSLALPDLLGCS
jgi:hypothetical protein